MCELYVSALARGSQARPGRDTRLADDKSRPHDQSVVLPPIHSNQRPKLIDKEVRGQDLRKSNDAASVRASQLIGLLTATAAISFKMQHRWLQPRELSNCRRAPVAGDLQRSRSEIYTHRN